MILRFARWVVSAWCAELNRMRPSGERKIPPHGDFPSVLSVLPPNERPCGRLDGQLRRSAPRLRAAECPSGRAVATRVPPRRASCSHRGTAQATPFHSAAAVMLPAPAGCSGATASGRGPRPARLAASVPSRSRPTRSVVRLSLRFATTRQEKAPGAVEQITEAESVNRDIRFLCALTHAASSMRLQSGRYPRRPNPVGDAIPKGRSLANRPASDPSPSASNPDHQSA